MDSTTRPDGQPRDLGIAEILLSTQLDAKCDPDASMSLTSWTRASLDRPCAVVELDARLLGLRLHATVVLDRLTWANFDHVARRCVAMSALDRPTGDDWRRLEPARLATSIATTRCEVMLALAKRWVVVNTLRDSCDPHIVLAVLDSLGVPADDYEILEPILRDMPADTVVLWRSLRAGGLWQQRVGDVIEACTTIATSGPLAVLMDGQLGLGRRRAIDRHRVSAAADSGAPDQDSGAASLGSVITKRAPPAGLPSTQRRPR
jgi:hypothetical protein